MNVKFPRGYGFTKGATSLFSTRVVGDGMADVQVDPHRGVVNTNHSPNISVRYSSGSTMARGRIQIDCKIYYCEEGKECLLDDVRYEVPLAAKLVEGDSTIPISISLVPDY